jgi:hypothetical protein
LVTLDTAGFAFGSHEVKLSISHTYNEITDDTVFSSECTVTEGGSTKVLNDFCVWVPTGTYQTSGSTFLSSIYMCGIVDPPNAVIPYPAPEEISEIPLYGFFNVDNNWEVVSFSREYSPNTLSPITPLNDQVCHGSDDISISLFGSQQLTTWTISSTSQEKTLSAVSGGVSFISSDYYGVETGTEVFESAAGSTQLYSISAAECNSRFPGFTGFSSSTIYWFRYNYGVAVLTAENINDYVPIGRVALVVPHDDCDAILGLSQQVTGVGQTTITDGKAQFTNNLTGVLYAEIKAVNPDGSPGATLWSGIDRRYSRFTLISSAVTDAHDSVSYPGFEVLEQDVWLYAPVQREVASYAVGDQHNLPTNSILVRSGILPSVIPDLVTANDRDWEVFMYAPDGVCSMGNRDVFMTPAVMLSANYLSFLGRGQPSDMELITSDGFTNGNSFVGWA